MLLHLKKFVPSDPAKEYWVGVPLSRILFWDDYAPGVGISSIQIENQAESVLVQHSAIEISNLYDAAYLRMVKSHTNLHFTGEAKHMVKNQNDASVARREESTE